MTDRLLQKPLIGITVSHNYGQGRFWLPSSYCTRVEDAGAFPLLLPAQRLSAAEKMPVSLGGLLLSGGVDIAPFYYGESPGSALGEVDPERDAWELALVRTALIRGLPVLGICRGMQLLNVALGGTLIQNLTGPDHLQHYQKAPRHHPSHTVEIAPRTSLAALLGRGHLAVNSFHHQAPAAVAPGLKAAAFSPDGVVEALEKPDHRFFFGVQWHPEALSHPASEHLFRAFVNAAAEFC